MRIGSYFVSVSLSERNYHASSAQNYQRTMKALLIALVELFVGTALAGSDPNSALIVPGSRLGAVRLGSNGAEVLKSLPKPYVVDSGMSQTRQVWRSRRPGGDYDTLFIHTLSNGVIDAKPAEGVTIDLIRSTAKRFHTANGISVGSPFKQVSNQFSGITAVKDVPTVYDDVNKGIAFEFDKPPTAESRCIAIMVHLPGKSKIATKEQVAAILSEKGG